MRFTLEPINLFLKDRFTTHVDSRTVQHSHIIKIEDKGFVGIGEVTAHPFYKMSRKRIVEDFQRIKYKYEGSRYDGPESFWNTLRKDLSENTFLLSGLDVASNDLNGKINGLSLHELWGAPYLNGSSQKVLPVSSYTIGIDKPEIMLAKMKAMPWSNYKIKLGTAEDLPILTLLRSATNVPFRIDANCAWDSNTLLSMNEQLSDMNIEFIEQPIHPDKKNEIRRSKGQSNWDLVADESFKTEADLDFCAENFEIINIKLVKCGGLTPARRVIKSARKKGLKIMIGCMTESSISISAASQLLPWVDYADLDGALLLKNDIAKGTVIKSERSILSNKPGIGVVVNEA